jgi:flagellin|tara:strand:+ start:15438 stop:16601 length:1164 start_codon:yes stop_codon:yes gene_type:complete
MALNIVSNAAAATARRNLAASDAAASNSVAKLSSGTRVLTAKDDAAAMAIGSRLESEVSSLKQAQVNAGQATSMLQIADGAMSRTQDILVRMKTLAVQSSSGQLSDTERGMLDKEFQELLSEVDRIATDTEFNGTALLKGGGLSTGTLGTTIDASVGLTNYNFAGNTLIKAGDDVDIGYDATNDRMTATVNRGGVAIASQTLTGVDGANTATQTINFDAIGLSLDMEVAFDQTVAIDSTLATSDFTVAGGGSSLGLTYRVGTGTIAQDEIAVTINSAKAADLSASLDTSDITTSANAETAMTRIDTAIDKLAENRASVGASQNRLEFAAANISTAMENSESARSALMDLDVAAEMSSFTSKQILIQAGVSMLSQANQLPQNLTRLFG